MFSISCPNPCTNILVPCCTSVTLYVYFLESLWDSVKAKYPLPALSISSTVCLKCGGGKDYAVVKIHNTVCGNFGDILRKMYLSLAHLFSLSQSPQESCKGSFLSVICHHLSLYGADDPYKLLLQKARFFYVDLCPGMFTGGKAVQ